jgi:hypothetical protein
MRPQRTREEQISINLVASYLRNDGYEVIEDFSVHDNPDWVFWLNGKRVAAECRMVSLEKLMKWNNSKRTLSPEKNYKITFPIEPHLWIKKAIEEKEVKIPQYLKNSDADEAWLIIHSDFTPGMALYECHDWMLEFMKLAAGAKVSEFKCVWFVHPEVGAHRLWDATEPRTGFPSLDLSNGNYPTQTCMKLIGTLKSEDFLVSVGPENTVEHITLQPLDKRYRIMDS